MKRLALASVLISIGAFGACAVEEPPTTQQPVAGAGPVGGASPAAGGAGGMAAQGGTSGTTSGTSGTTGGVLPTGGSGGDGTITGGIGGSGGDLGLGGQALGGQSMGGQAMGGQAMGGQAMGGQGMGGAGTGGTGGMPCPTTAQLFPVASVTGQQTGLTGNPNPAGAMGSLDGYLIMTPCTDTACDDCSGGGWIYNGTTTGCSGSLNAVQNFTVGGTPGTRYRATLHFYGIVEPKNYGNVATRQSGSMRPNNSDSGATPAPWAYATGNPTYTVSDYNTYEIHVVDNNGMEVCSHFLNSDTTEGHWTYVLNYAKTIDVIGGGRVRVRVYDRNCRMIKNCYGGGSQGPCNTNGCNPPKPRTVTVPNAPAALVQPGLGNDANQSGQWLHIKVEQVQCGMPNLTCAGM
jgi:hypothetical protein